MDIGSLVGIVMAVGAILLGNKLEGGHIDQIIQGTAALIVLGGTTGAGIAARAYPPGSERCLSPNRRRTSL